MRGTKKVTVYTKESCLCGKCPYADKCVKFGMCLGCGEVREREFWKSCAISVGIGWAITAAFAVLQYLGIIKGMVVAI